jgi:hypothetical protein
MNNYKITKYLHKINKSGKSHSAINKYAIKLQYYTSGLQIGGNRETPSILAPLSGPSNSSAPSSSSTSTSELPIQTWDELAKRYDLGDFLKLNDELITTSRPYDILLTQLDANFPFKGSFSDQDKYRRVAETEREKAIKYLITVPTTGPEWNVTYSIETAKVQYPGFVGLLDRLEDRSAFYYGMTGFDFYIKPTSDPSVPKPNVKFRPIIAKIYVESMKGIEALLRGLAMKDIRNWKPSTTVESWLQKYNLDKIITDRPTDLSLGLYEQLNSIKTDESNKELIGLYTKIDKILLPFYYYNTIAIKKDPKLSEPIYGLSMPVEAMNDIRRGWNYGRFLRDMTNTFPGPSFGTRLGLYNPTIKSSMTLPSQT